MEELKHFFSQKKIYKILDVGTGAGQFLNVLKETFPESDIFGVDPNQESLTEAKINFPEIGFSVMAAEKLSFENDIFDVVSISMALHHLQDVKNALKELKRVVKPGGWIIVNELFSDNLNSAQEVHNMFHHFRSTIDRLQGICHNETFRKDEIIQYVKQSGFSVELFFEYKKDIILAGESLELEMREEKLEAMLQQIKGLPEYNALLPQIEEFKKRAKKYGFQPATNVVIVGRK
jgi:ubiquinone/menaquinone biosynthesis C-methylase UbiE